MTAALQCDRLGVRLQGHAVLHDIDLDLPAGQWIAIVGPNGAGKSTLLRALSGLLPASGEVRLLGRSLADWPARERARSLAWMGQNEGGAEDLRVLDVVMLGRLPHQAWLAPPSAADHAAVQAAMQQTQSWEWRERRLATLSGGERQRVLLARALAVEAPVLMLDEPLAHLDPPHQADWIELVRALVGAGRTVITVLHELNIALLADRLLVMQSGRVRHHGVCDDPAVREALQQVFEHRLQLVQWEGRWLCLPGAGLSKSP
ncbi:MAG: ABC transporter ATP-binding protein [Paucibacter sp.]|nr:ABC transporter ATP-binding protein [Roseateles sp.]